MPNDFKHTENHLTDVCMDRRVQSVEVHADCQVLIVIAFNASTLRRATGSKPGDTIHVGQQAIWVGGQSQVASVLAPPGTAQDKATHGADTHPSN